MKGLAALFMLIDHIGLVFFPQEVLWRMVGRLAMPLFAYGIASGFAYTSCLKDYIKRLTLFAICSQIPYSLMCYMVYGFIGSLNIGFTFLAALIVLQLLEKQPNAQNNELKNYGLILIALGLAQWLQVDYGIYGILTVITFYEYIFKREMRGLGYLIFIGLTLVECILFQNSLQIFACFALGFLNWSSHKASRKSRYFFYVFYPLHLMLVCLIKWWIG